VHDVAELDQVHRENLCVTCLRWVDAVVDDPDYTILESVRHPLTHRSLDRHVYATTVGGGIPPGTYRLGLFVPGGAGGPAREISSGEIVEHARDTATGHILSLLEAAIAGAL